MKTGEIVKDILQEKGLKISWLAEKLNIKNNTLSNRLCGELKVDFAIKICDVLKISLDEIYNRYQLARKN